MTNSQNLKPFVPKKPSPFNVDPYNNRGGKLGNKALGANNKNGAKLKSINVSNFKTGSGGDR